MTYRPQTSGRPAGHSTLDDSNSSSLRLDEGALPIEADEYSPWTEVGTHTSPNQDRAIPVTSVRGAASEESSVLRNYSSAKRETVFPSAQLSRREDDECY